MIRRPPRSTRTDTLFPYTTLFRSSRLRLGQMAIEGLPALTIVASKRVWVEANFKETELAKMLPGQRAEIRIDAYPDLKLNGHVESLGAGTGSRSEEHTSELQSLMRISYAVFCLKKKKRAHQALTRLTIRQ